MHIVGSLQTKIGYEVVFHTETWTGSPPIPLVATVEAPEGMRVVGGGFDIAEADVPAGWSANGYIEYSRPTSDGGAWETSAWTNGDQLAALTVWAVCVDAC